jgi:phosphoribosylamine--glycine ligase
MACAEGGLGEVKMEWSPRPAITVVMAADGYPNSYTKGDPIRGVDKAAGVEGATVFHAGTKTGATGLEANGGRVLNVSATGVDIGQARDAAYKAIDLIDWPGGFYRSDIAWRVLGKD